MASVSPFSGLTMFEKGLRIKKENEAINPKERKKGGEDSESTLPIKVALLGSKHDRLFRKFIKKSIDTDEKNGEILNKE